MVSVAVCPFRYIPDDRELALYRQVDFSIRYTTGSYTATGHISPQMQSLTKNFVKDMVVNPQNIQEAKRPSVPPGPVIGTCAKQVLHWQPDNIGDRPEYIIITNNALKQAFQALAAYKTQRGIPTVIATVEDIYNRYPGVDHPEQIRNYLKDVKQYWNTVNILIGGDSDIVPARFISGAYHNIVPTDRYYNDLIENRDITTMTSYHYTNFFNNIDNIIGRLPVKTPQEVINMIQKIKFYERLNVGDRNYINHFLLTGAYYSYTDSTHYSTGIMTQAAQFYNDPILNGKSKWMLLDNFRGNSQDVVLFPNGCTGEEFDKEIFTNALNNGHNGQAFHFVYHADHSNPYAIGTSSEMKGQTFNTQDADNLHNTYPQIMLSIGCEPGQFDKDCFAEHYINNPNGGGVAILANPEETSTGVGYFIPKAFFNKVYGVGNSSLGLAAMNIYAAPRVGGAKDTYELFGDPSMQVWSDAPQDITLSVPTDINIDNGTTNPYTVHINELNEPATLTVYKYNTQTQQIEVYGSQRLAAHTTSATFYLRPDTEGDLTVTATAKNYIPATASTYIHLPQAHLYVINTAFNDANGNGAIEPGETVDLSLTLTNSGGATIDNVQTVLEPDMALYGLVTVTQANVNAPGSFAPGTQQTLSGYQFQVGNNGTIPRYLKFWLKITDDNGYQHRDEIYLDMTNVQLDLGPRLVYDDDGNIINPDQLQDGVEYNLYIGIANNSSVSQGISSATLTSGDTNLIQVLQASSTYPDIPAFERQNNTTAYRIKIMDMSNDTLPLNLHITNAFGVTKDFSFDLLEAMPPTISGYHFTSTDTSIKLMWHPVWDTHKGFNIYRSDDINGTYAKVNPQIITGSSMYEDTDVAAAHTYFYKISVVSLTNNEIPLDNLLTALDYNNGHQVQGYKAWTTLPLQTGFPVKHTTNTEVTTAPCVLDIDGDSNKEIFVNSLDWRGGLGKGRIFSYDNQGRELFNFDGNATNLEGFALTEYTLRSKAGIYDIDGDGNAEVFAMSRNNSPAEGRIYGFYTIDTHPNDNLDAPDKLWDNTNNFINVEINGNNHRSLHPPVLADVNNDGIKEIIMLDEHQSIHIYNSLTRDELFSTQINGAWYSETQMAIADLDHDGYKEIVFVVQKDQNHNNHSAVYYTHYNGTDFETVFVKELNGTTLNDCINRNIVLGDIDPDNPNQNQMEIFVIGLDNVNIIPYPPYCIPIQYSLYGLRMNGDFISPQWDSSINTNLQFSKVSGLSMGDVNGDGKPEVLVANGSKISIFAQDANKTDINLSGNAIGEPIIADVDDDADMEIVINAGHFLDAYNMNGTLCGGWHIPGLDANKTFAQSPYVGDIDNDGQNEVVIADNGATIYAWKTTGDAAKIEWGTERYNAQNTGAYESLNQMDLMVKDSPADTGVEPNTITQRFWESEDIWIRNHDDGGTQHEDPEYDSDHPVYVYVKVTNRGNMASTAQEKLHLYWANSNTDLEWPTPWDGHHTNPNGAVGGGEIGVADIPILQPGEQRIVKFTWRIPNVDNYDEVEPNTWHFCLLARIVSPNDQMTFTETTDLPANVANNNNIAWKNVMVIDVDPNQPDNILSGTVVVGNWSDTAHLYYLELVKDDSESGNPIFKEAEVKLKMGPKLYEAWERGGKIAEELESTADDKKKVVKGDNVLLDNLAFNPKEFGALTLTFNFLTKKITAKDRFKYHLIQRDAQTGKIVGGETFIIRKKPRPIFIADAQNQEADKGDLVTLSAENIDEAAVYNWYDMEGNLVYQGKDMTVSADMAKKFKLEVIATADGFKDYKEVEIKLKPNRIVSLTPNPVANNLEVTYKINEGSSAYLMLINVSGNNDVVGNYVVDVNTDTINIDMSNYPAGVYSVALVTDGQVTDVKGLAKN